MHGLEPTAPGGSFPCAASPLPPPLASLVPPASWARLSSAGSLCPSPRASARLTSLTSVLSHHLLDELRHLCGRSFAFVLGPLAPRMQENYRRDSLLACKLTELRRQLGRLARIHRCEHQIGREAFPPQIIPVIDHRVAIAASRGHYLDQHRLLADHARQHGWVGLFVYHHETRNAWILRRHLLPTIRDYNLAGVYPCQRRSSSLS